MRLIMTCHRRLRRNMPLSIAQFWCSTSLTISCRHRCRFISCRRPRPIGWSCRRRRRRRLHFIYPFRFPFRYPFGRGRLIVPSPLLSRSQGQRCLVGRYRRRSFRSVPGSSNRRRPLSVGPRLQYDPPPYRRRRRRHGRRARCQRHCLKIQPSSPMQTFRKCNLRLRQPNTDDHCRKASCRSRRGGIRRKQANRYPLPRAPP
jgi:hypothetical protein